jgi:hypothetical protein
MEKLFGTLDLMITIDEKKKLEFYFSSEFNKGFFTNEHVFVNHLESSNAKSALAHSFVRIT